MPISENDLKNAILTAIPDAEVICQDLAGDNDHWQVTVTSPVFKNKSRIEQHKIVQMAVSKHDIHALAIKTLS